MIKRLFIFSILFLSAHIFAENSGQISGVVFDFEKDQPLIGQIVILITHENDQSSESETITDDQGRYRFDQLPLSNEIYYTVKTFYANEEISETDLILNEWSESVTADLQISAFTNDPKNIRINQHSIIITPDPNHEHGEAVAVMEVVRIENLSKFPFQSEKNREGFWLDLPTSATHLQFDPSLKQKFSIDQNRITSTSPLPSGDSNLVFSYIVHLGKILDLSRKSTFNTSQIYAFIPTDLPLQPISQTLPNHTQEQIHDKIYALYTTAPNQTIDAEQNLDLRFEMGKPPTNSESETKNFWNYFLIAIASMSFGGFLVTIFLRLKHNSTQTDPIETPTPDLSWIKKLNAKDLEFAKNARLELISQIDEIYENGQISEKVHKRIRTEQEDRLTVILKQIRKK